MVSAFWAMAAALLGLLVFGLVMVLILYKPIPAPLTVSAARLRPPDYNTTLGSSTTGLVNQPSNCQAYTDQITCEASPAHIWNAQAPPHGRCECLIPFWDIEGYREAYEASYTAIGNPNLDQIRVTPLHEQLVDRLSFPYSAGSTGQLLCTQLCDEESACIGVLWQGATSPGMGIGTRAGQCTLLQGEVIVPGTANIPFLPTVDATLYLRGRDPLFIDRVFIYRDSLPLRYWLAPDSTEQLTAFVNTVYGLSFFPEHVLIGGNLTGVYSTIQFTADQIEALIEAGDDENHYIDQPGLPFSLPPLWQGRQIWVGYTYST